jgi:hypothetical protein
MPLEGFRWIAGPADLGPNHVVDPDREDHDLDGPATDLDRARRGGARDPLSSPCGTIRPIAMRVGDPGALGTPIDPNRDDVP